MCRVCFADSCRPNSWPFVSDFIVGLETCLVLDGCLWYGCWWARTSFVHTGCFGCRGQTRRNNNNDNKLLVKSSERFGFCIQFKKNDVWVVFLKKKNVRKQSFFCSVQKERFNPYSHSLTHNLNHSLNYFNHSLPLSINHSIN